MPNPNAIDDFAARYANAWSSQRPAAVAAFFAPNGSLTINDGPTAVGRFAIADAARGFMTAFPDLQVFCDHVTPTGDRVEFHWTLDGHNTGPGGKGNRVRLSGFEEWRLSDNGLIQESRGHFAAAEYQRQIEHGYQC
jgi:uncharacterized protein (TIGR02246 family)